MTAATSLAPAPTRPASRYDPVARTLHWLMAVGILGSLASASAHFLAEDSALDKLLWPTHKHLGFALALLALLRLGWTASRPPGARPPHLNRAAAAGHALLYVLMLAIPSIALLRQYGSGRAFSPLGLPLFPGFDPANKIVWMTELGGALHGELGWLLAVMIVGHVGAVVWHRLRGEDVLPRMLPGRG